MKNRKRLLGYVLLVLGVIASLYAMHLKGRISDAKGNISKGKSLSPTFPGDKIVTDVLEGQVSQYDRPVRLLQIGGIIVAILGAGLIFMSRKR